MTEPVDVIILAALDTEPVDVIILAAIDALANSLLAQRQIFCVFCSYCFCIVLTAFKLIPNKSSGAEARLEYGYDHAFLSREAD